MRPATRDRKERFIKSFGETRAREAILALFYRHGLAALADDQIDEITSDMAVAARSTCRRNVCNRRINSAAAKGGRS